MRTCDLCPQKHYAKGRCFLHWHRDWKQQDREKGERAACSEQGCDKPAICRGWCDMHYCRVKRVERAVKAGIATVQVGAADARADLRTCTIPGCDLPHRGRGFCSKHYARWFRHGDPNYVRPLQRSTNVRVRAQLAGVRVVAPKVAAIRTQNMPPELTRRPPGPPMGRKSREWGGLPRLPGAPAATS